MLPVGDCVAVLETLADAPTDWESDGDALLLDVTLALALLDSDEVAETEELALCTVAGVSRKVAAVDTTTAVKAGVEGRRV
jgi:hypothetical protein